MPVVREGIVDLQPPHDGEGDLIHEPGLAGRALPITVPGGAPVVIGGEDQSTRRFQPLAQEDHVLPHRRSGRRVAALGQDVGRRHHRDSIRQEPGEGPGRRAMSLVVLVPEGDQSDGVQEDGPHG